MTDADNPVCRQGEPSRMAEGMEDLPVLGRDAILGAEDLVTEQVEVPEWGGIVYLRTMTGAERDAWEERQLVGRGRSRRVNLENIRASLVAQVVMDAEGNRLFARADIPALGAKSARALDRIFAAAQRLNGLTAEDIEELAGNSPGDRSDVSGSS